MCIMYSTYRSWYSCASAILALSLWSASCSIGPLLWTASRKASTQEDLNFSKRLINFRHLKPVQVGNTILFNPWKWMRMVENVTPFHLFPAFMTQAHHGVVTPCPSNVCIWGLWNPHKGKGKHPRWAPAFGVDDPMSSVWFVCLLSSPTRSYDSQDSEDETDASQSSKACNCNAVKQRLHLLAWSCLRMIYATHTQLVMSVGFGSMIPFMIHSCINRIFVKHIYIISSSPSINEHHVLSRFFCQRRWTRFTLRPKLVNLSSNMLSFETFSVVDRQEESPMTDASSSKTTDREENGRDTIRRIDSLESF